MWYELALILAFTFTALMTGIVWFVQVNHYPLFLKAGEASFTEYEKEHTRLAGIVIAPVMLMELFFSALLLFQCSDFAHAAILGLLLLALIWLSTFLISVPIHRKLSACYDESLVKKLIRTNWIRTIGWTLRLVILGATLFTALVKYNS